MREVREIKIGAGHQAAIGDIQSGTGRITLFADVKSVEANKATSKRDATTSTKTNFDPRKTRSSFGS